MYSIDSSDAYIGSRLSWRVPHTPKAARIATHAQQGQRSLEHSPQPSKKSPSSSKKQPSVSSGASQQRDRGSASLMQSTWVQLFAEVNHSADELYALCEGHADEGKCLEAVDMFERCRLDFDQLVVRIEEQRRFELDQSGGVVWDVRKPVHPPLSPHASPPSALSPHVAFKSQSPVHISPASPVEEQLQFNFHAQPEPCIVAALVPSADEEQPPASEAVADAAEGDRAGVHPRSGSVSSSASNATGGHRRKRQPKKRRSPGTQPLSRGLTIEIPSEKECWLEQVEMQIESETEAAWAEAEAFVDRESAAEEREWRRMAMGSDHPSPANGRSDYSRLSDSGSQSSLFSNASGSPSKKALPRYRLLHEKLSAPVNSWKSLSSSEAREKHLARQGVAEQNRVKTAAEMRHKLQLVSDRAKERASEREREKSLKEQALEDRLRDGGRRREEFIRSRRDKALNESLKVSEIQFINTLNEEELKEQLQGRLNDIEQRVQAAAVRRQMHLESISVRQRKASSTKSRQMSAVRLRIETERMDRWNRLKERIDAVQRRRELRLLELQRRADVGDKCVDGLEAAAEELETSAEEGEADETRHARKKKTRRKKTYSSQLRHVLAALSASAADESSAATFARLVLRPALEVSSVLSQKRGARDSRTALASLCSAVVDRDAEGAEKGWTERLRGMFAALGTADRGETLRQRETGCAFERHLCAVEGEGGVEALVRSGDGPSSLALVVGSALAPRPQDQAEALVCCVFETGLLGAVWRVIAAADRLAPEVLVVSTASAVDCVNLLLTCYTLCVASAERMDLTVAVHPLCCAVDLLCVRLARLTADEGDAELHTLLSFAFSSGLLVSLSRAAESAVFHLVGTADQVSASQLLLTAIASLVGTICDGLCKSKPVVKVRSFEDSVPLRHPKGREWVNVLSSCAVVGNLMHAVLVLDAEVATQSALECVWAILDCFAQLARTDPFLMHHAGIGLDGLFALLCQLIEPVLVAASSARDCDFNKVNGVLGLLGAVAHVAPHSAADSSVCPRLAQLLCDLPIHYFIVDARADVLMPALVALLLRSPAVLAVLERNLHQSYMSDWLLWLSGSDSERSMRVSRVLPARVLAAALELVGPAPLRGS